MLREETLRDGDGVRTAVGWTPDDGGRTAGLAVDSREDDGVATGSADDPAARLDSARVFVVGRRGVEGADIVVLGRGRRKDMFRSVTTPLGRRILYERGASP
jgi:hypothetical protein